MGAAGFLVNFRAVNAKTELLYCTLPSLDEILDQVADEKPTISASWTCAQDTTVSG